MAPGSQSLYRFLVSIEGREAMTVKILIVDDEEFILDEASETLTDEGYDCFVAGAVGAAVEIVKTTPGISLILTDLKLRGETGTDLIRIIEAEYEQNIKFIVMSGHASPSSKADGDGIDMASYPFLRKPLDIEMLIEMVDSVLEGKG
jgi:DNA-binding NtrC family response regulator